MTGPGAGVLPEVSVVVPYYCDQEGLDRLLAALELQTLSAFELVVADDGSPEPPVIGPRPFPVQVVRQEDRGFRAAAARNLGARAARGRVLAFLDGDMVPEPGYLAAALAGATDDRTLVVGRRRHAALAGWDAGRTRAWLTGGDAPAPLGDPEWLADGYAATDDLRAADDRSYRFVISAVLTLPRERFLQVGGFAEFAGYGGEDWELAHRWRHEGGSFRHAPDAVAWQDGADFGRRGDAAERLAIKDAEALRLAPLLPVPGARDPRLVWRVPAIAVDLDAAGLTPAQALACLAPLVDGSDAAVWVAGLPEVLAAGLEDPRVRQPGEGSPQLSTYRVTVHRPGVLTGRTLGELVAHARLLPAGPDPGEGALTAPGSAALTVRHVPTGAEWHLAPDAATWAPLPSAGQSVEELWSAGL